MNSQPARLSSTMDSRDFGSYEKSPPANSLANTWTGRRYDVLNPDPDTIHILDIAAPLAQKGRYGQQSILHLPIAAHLVTISMEAEDIARSQGLPEEEVIDIARWGLLHDAPEHLLSDILTPLKAKLPDYKLIEKTNQSAMARRFGLSPEEPGIVKYLDRAIVKQEVLAAVVADPAEMGCPDHDFRHFVMPDIGSHWTFYADMFMDRFNQICVIDDVLHFSFRRYWRDLCHAIREDELEIRLTTGRDDQVGAELISRMTVRRAHIAAVKSQGIKCFDPLVSSDVRRATEPSIR